MTRKDVEKQILALEDLRSEGFEIRKDTSRVISPDKWRRREQEWRDRLHATAPETERGELSLFARKFEVQTSIGPVLASTDETFDNDPTARANQVLELHDERLVMLRDVITRLKAHLPPPARKPGRKPGPVLDDSAAVAEALRLMKTDGLTKHAAARRAERLADPGGASETANISRISRRIDEAS